ncbi:MAG: universal stress protein [Chloroflexi bacterium]|nr:MAG: universal stress protein [Chloroflexota bacterium]
MSSIKKIMIPLDGSPLSEMPLVPASKLAKAINALLILLRVQEPSALMDDEALKGQVSQLKGDAALKYLDEVAHKEMLSGVELESMVVNGQVAESIIDSAAENDVDLIVMSSHGRSGISRWVYGSVAEKVLRQAPCATIIQQSKADVPMFSNKRILVTLDGSALAERVLESVRDIAQATGSELILLRVTGMIQLAIDSVDPLVMKQDLDKLEERERIEAKEYLERVQHKLFASGLTVKVEVTSGHVAETILAYAEENDVDLIAMSSYGRSGVGRWFYGSVAEKVLRGAHSAMLIKRGKKN